MDSENPSLPKSGSNFPEPHGFNPKEASRFTGMSESWLSKARMGITPTKGPRFKKVGRRVIYTLDSLNDFLNS